VYVRQCCHLPNAPEKKTNFSVQYEQRKTWLSQTDRGSSLFCNLACLKCLFIIIIITIIVHIIAREVAF